MPKPDIPLPGKANFDINTRKDISQAAAFRLHVETLKSGNAVSIKPQLTCPLLNLSSLWIFKSLSFSTDESHIASKTVQSDGSQANRDSKIGDKDGWQLLPCKMNSTHLELPLCISGTMPCLAFTGLTSFSSFNNHLRLHFSFSIMSNRHTQPYLCEAHRKCSREYYHQLQSICTTCMTDHHTPSHTNCFSKTCFILTGRSLCIHFYCQHTLSQKVALLQLAHWLSSATTILYF